MAEPDVVVVPDANPKEPPVKVEPQASVPQTPGSKSTLVYLNSDQTVSLKLETVNKVHDEDASIVPVPDRFKGTLNLRGVGPVELDLTTESLQSLANGLSEFLK